ncbi:hypothetical protein HGRIS_010274 [Hohenbuehelia grisea]|uniref:Uncharacterized protein n=1 Tax=Hohenbuehelia grisea TaxID=104357 RepID=A0ABR3J4A8_9AGAR
MTIMKPTVVHAITFPPFPKAPPGVDIIPFSEFTECGIEIELFGDGDAEVDGRGIPTLEIKKKHDTDVVKSNPRKRKIDQANETLRQEQEAAAKAGDAEARKKIAQRKPQPEWWQEWQAGEELRFASPFQESMTAQDRLFSATNEFLETRPVLPTLVRELWDQFRVFIGALDHHIQPKDKESSSKGKARSIETTDRSVRVQDSDDEAEDGDAYFQHASKLTSRYDDIDEDDDDEFYGDMDPSAKDSNTSLEPSVWPSFLPRPDASGEDTVSHGVADSAADVRATSPTHDRDMEIEVPDNLANIDKAVADDSTLRPLAPSKTYLTPDMRLQSFIDNPEDSIRVFLSSYLRNKGLIWYADEEYNVMLADPICFRYDRNLTYAPRLARFWVEHIRRSNILKTDTETAVAVDAALNAAKAVADLALKELPLTAIFGKTIPDAFSKACKDCWGPKEKGEIDARDFTTSLSLLNETGGMASEPEVVKDGRSAKRAKTDDTTNDAPVEAPGEDSAMEVDETAKPTEATVSWETAPSWDVTDEASALAWGGSEPAGDEAPAALIWAGNTNFLMPILRGPLALPLTHRTGIVEGAMRRIGRVIRAGSAEAIAALDNLPPSIGPSAAAVEAEMAVRFARVELTPWRGWDGDRNHTWPYIHPSSSGPAVYHTGPPTNLTDEEKADAVARASPGAHDPLKDSITLLVAAELAESFEQGVGMGLEGVFVQLVRDEWQDEDSDLDWDQHSNENEVDMDAPVDDVPRYWYIERHTKAFPSYYTRNPMLGSE